jgi:hypothetical protein
MYEQIRQIIETRVLRNSGSLRTISFPVYLEGREFDQPTGSNWAVMFISESSNLKDEFNSDLTEGNLVSGSIRFKLYSPHGSGSKAIRGMADELNGFLNYSSGNEGISGVTGNLQLRNGNLTPVSDDDDGYLQYNLDYIFNYYT